MAPQSRHKQRRQPPRKRVASAVLCIFHCCSWGSALLISVCHAVLLSESVGSGARVTGGRGGVAAWPGLLPGSPPPPTPVVLDTGQLPPTSCLFLKFHGRALPSASEPLPPGLGRFCPRLSSAAGDRRAARGSRQCAAGSREGTAAGEGLLHGNPHRCSSGASGERQAAQGLAASRNIFFNKCSFNMRAPQEAVYNVHSFA